VAQLDLKNCDIYIEDGHDGSVTGTTLVNHKLADPTSAPTVSATGGGASGGSLAAGTYLISYTLVTAYGETLRSSATSGIVVSSGNIPRVTFPALPTGAVSRKLYISTDGGGAGTQTLYASGITTLTYDMSIAAPGSGAFPTVSTASLDYAAATTTMLVDGSTGAVVTGDRFWVDGDPGVAHTVTAHSETLSNTTSITFTPALGDTVADDATIHWLPNQLHIRVGEGNVQWTEKRSIQYTKDRGTLDTVKLGDEEPVEVKLDFTWVFLRADTGEAPSIEDALKKRGEASDWISSSADLCEPYAVDIVIVYTPPCSDIDKEIYRLQDFRYEDLGHDLKQGQVSVSGKCNITEPTTTRSGVYPF